MKISILTPDLSNNCFGRAYLLAKILQKNYEVEIIGPIFRKKIWEPLSDINDVTYKSIKIGRIPKSYWQVSTILKNISGDIVYASKPLFSSFGIGLIEKLLNKKTLILDVDDWQMGFRNEQYKNFAPANRIKYLIYSMFQFYETTSYWNNLIGEMLALRADEITVSNTFLKEKFGGTIVWHCRNTDVFDPQLFNRDSFRSIYAIPKNKKVVMFLGTPNVHKGLDDLIEAVKLTNNLNIVLSIVGIGNDPYSKKLEKLGKAKLGNRFLPFRLQPFEKVPEFLTIADVVVIPQRENFATIGQVPAKVFDAMAMAKPVIATNVSDLPIILKDCGWIVEPENIGQLAESIQHVINSPEEAEDTGSRARQKCIENYSWNAMENILTPLFRKYV